MNWLKQKPKPWLEDSIANALVRRGITSIRQSWLSQFRECPHKALSMYRSEGAEYSTVHTLLGSVFHKALEFSDDCIESGNSIQWWIEVFHMVKEESNGAVWMHKGERVTTGMVDDFCREFVGTYKMQMIIARVHAWFHNKGLIILHQEFKMNHVVNGVSFIGTIDIVATDSQGRLYFLDCKTSGMWNPIVKDKAVKAMNLSIEDAAYHTQLNHYDWLYGKCHGKRAYMHGILAPVNLVPLTRKSGEKAAGSDRGALAVMAAPAQKDYESQLKGWLGAIAEGVSYKSFPERFGESLCFQCPLFKQCRSGDSAATVDIKQVDVGEYL